MRVWSLHPQYLDTKGLVALWRETLLAKHVLEGRTKGYKNHPQLSRFKTLKDPAGGINQYLASVLVESKIRGFKFDESKIDWNFKPVLIDVTDGQISYEVQHLLNKLEARDPERYKGYTSLADFHPHPIFKVVSGETEDWEIT